MTEKILKHIFKNKKKINGPILINVCAWCPKEDYPILKDGQEYTHGMCRRHYKQLSIKKNLPLSFHVAEFFETTLNHIDVKSRKSSSAIMLYSKKYFEYLKAIIKFPREELGRFSS